jgi:F-type H+-transporting ATPase subunit alpha
MAFVYTGGNEANHDMEGGAKVLDSLASIDVHETKKFVDCFGRALGDDDDDDTDGDNLRRAIYAPIPKVSDIALINSPLVTGVTMFDALAPIGKGQNMLLIGHDIQDMRQYVCDLVSIQRQSTKCVYASTTENKETVEMLTKAGLIDDLVLVSARNMDGMDKASMAAEATVTAATACSIAESFALEKGMDTLVIIDTIDHHKSLWDATTRVLVDVFGVDAVVKGEREGAASSEMRAFFSSLIQRSAQYNTKKGGGSVTLLLLITIPKIADTDDDMEFSPDDFASAPKKVKDRIDLLVQRKVPLTAATLRKIQIPVPSDAEGIRRLALQHVDDLISMSDGQIWLDEELEKNGRRPAMDFQRSVTRIGIGADTESRADAPAMRRVVEGLRLDLSQALDMAGADVGTNASKNQARNALAWLLAMHQPSSRGARKLSESCVAMLAASKGYLRDSVDKGAVAGTTAGDEVISGLLDHVTRTASEAMHAIDQTNDLTEENQQAIEKSIQSFFS